MAHDTQNAHLSSRVGLTGAGGEARDLSEVVVQGVNHLLVSLALAVRGHE